MKWLTDIIMLMGEWLLIMIIPFGIGILIGWFLWNRKWRKSEAKKRSLHKELTACRDELTSLSVSSGENIQAMKNKLSTCRNENKQIKVELDKALEILDDMEKEVKIELAEEDLEVVAVEKEKEEDLDTTIEEDIEDKKIVIEAEQLSIADLPEEKDEFEEELAKASEGMVLDYEDNLKLISGVGPKMEKMLKDFGVKTFYQLSNFDEKGIEALNGRINAFPGRIERDDWIGQAKKLYGEHHA